MTPQEIAESLYARAAELASDHDERTIFHGYALAFGMAMSAYLPPDLAATFLRQELGRVEQLAASETSETVQ